MLLFRKRYLGLLVKSALFTFLTEEVHWSLLVRLDFLWQQWHNHFPCGFRLVTFAVGLWVAERQHLQGLGLDQRSSLLDAIRATVEH